MCAITSDSKAIERFAYIDALRGIAFLAVLAVHVSSQIPNIPDWCARLCNLGNYGVQLFFIVSSFTLSLSMTARAHQDRHQIYAFAIRRFFRIAPMYWLAIPFYILLNGRGVTHFAPYGIGAPQIITNYLFAHGWSPSTINSTVPGGWSIAVEMNFYVLFPFLFRYLNTWLRALGAIIIALPISVGVSALTYHWIEGTWDFDSGLLRDFTYYWLPRQLPVFLLGIAAFRLFANKAAQSEFLRLKPIARHLMMVALAILVLTVLASKYLPLLYFLLACEFVLIGACLSVFPSGIIVNRVFRYTGMVSYSAYLWHFAVVQVVSKFAAGIIELPSSSTMNLGKLVVFYTVCWAVTLCLSTATYRGVELPFQKIGKRILSESRRERHTIL